MNKKGHLNKNAILENLRENKSYFQDKYGASDIILFGSYAKDNPRPDSDVDIAVQTELSDYFLLYDMKEDFEKILNSEVYIVRIRKRMNEVLKKRINKEGIIV